MPLCGFNEKMIEGIATFSEGLFEATIERGNAKGVDNKTAIETEIDEISIFIEALKSKYKTPDNVTKKMAEMIYGIAVFSGALFQSAMNKSKNGNELEVSFYEQVKNISKFLEDLENKHQELKKMYAPKETMKKAVDWIDNNDK
jgi:uncharacterized protein YicC (UPF0701 family)